MHARFFPPIPTVGSDPVSCAGGNMHGQPREEPMSTVMRLLFGYTVSIIAVFCVAMIGCTTPETSPAPASTATSEAVAMSPTDMPEPAPTATDAPSYANLHDGADRHACTSYGDAGADSHAPARTDGHDCRNTQADPYTTAAVNAHADPHVRAQTDEHADYTERGQGTGKRRVAGRQRADAREPDCKATLGRRRGRRVGKRGC